MENCMVEITEFVWCEHLRNINQLLKELKEPSRLCDWSTGTKIVIQFNETQCYLMANSNHKTNNPWKIK